MNTYTSIIDPLWMDSQRKLMGILLKLSWVAPSFAVKSSIKLSGTVLKDSYIYTGKCNMPAKIFSIYVALCGDKNQRKKTCLTMSLLIHGKGNENVFVGCCKIIANYCCLENISSKFVSILSVSTVTLGSFVSNAARLLHFQVYPWLYPWYR